MSELELAGSGCSLHEPYALQVLGNEMEPEFPDRCIVIIEPTDQCPNHAFVFADVEGVRWFRQYARDAAGKERLVALNALYPDIELEGLAWSVLGVIIQRNIRRQVKHYDYTQQPSSRTAAKITDLTGQ
ncbi:S24 family peptidase [Thiorhodococcus mannitoliphagus]|uniref:S24 family peptidase n=1 Tax=Thiorhodococcus mannitoliphagus TaxID=329406 RepID=A0A6P1DN84_9GAMM|nr:S24 family peptidase [Thiorhodococcus mannitoliphagus]NEX19707.1 S24 family peptidase [Thiorhodococcus mannitoliphagus]